MYSDMEVYIPDIDAPQQLCMSERELTALLDLSAAAAGRNTTAAKQLTTEQLVQLGSAWSRIKCAVCKKGLGIFEGVGMYLLPFSSGISRIDLHAIF